MLPHDLALAFWGLGTGEEAEVPEKGLGGEAECCRDELVVHVDGDCLDVGGR